MPSCRGGHGAWADDCGLRDGPAAAAYGDPHDASGADCDARHDEADAAAVGDGHHGCSYGLWLPTNHGIPHQAAAGGHIP